MKTEKLTQISIAYYSRTDKSGIVVYNDHKTNLHNLQVEIIFECGRKFVYEILLLEAERGRTRFLAADSVSEIKRIVVKNGSSQITFIEDKGEFKISD